MGELAETSEGEKRLTISHESCDLAALCCLELSAVVAAVVAVAVLMLL